MSMKLGALATTATDVATPARMVVVDAESQLPLKDKDDKECWIDFLSIDSEAGRKLNKATRAAAFRKARSGRNIIDDEDPVDEQVTVLVALTTDWYFGEDADKFTPQNARELFSNPEYSWLRKLAFVFVQSEANFIKRSSKNSASSPSKISAATAS